MKHWGRWLLFEQLVFFPKHVTLPEKMRLAWLVSIPLALLTLSEVLPCAGGPVMSLDMSEKFQLLPVRIPSFFEQNVLKAVGRTQEGSCKVYVGKTTWKTNWKLCPWSLASKKWGALEAPWQMTPIRAAFVCSKACDIAGEDAFSVASQHSIGLIDIKWGTFMRRRTSYVTWYVGEMPPSSRENSQFCRTECFESRMPTCSSENSQLVRTECLENSRQNTRGKLQGVCGKDYLENKLKAVPLEPCKQEVRSTWSTLTDDSYSSSFCLFQSMWHCRRRCV